MYIPMGHGLQPSVSVSKRHPSRSGTTSLFEEDPRPPDWVLLRGDTGLVLVVRQERGLLADAYP
jgi:hypothetical protein